MKFLSTLRQDLKKTVGNYCFLICVLLTAGLCFTAIAYSNEEKGISVTVLDAILYKSRAEMLSDSSYSLAHIFSTASTGYLPMFLPMIAAFPFIPNFCSERNSGLIRMTIFRTGKYRYYFSKFLSAMIGGGMAVALGCGLYCGVSSFFFPLPESYPVNMELVNMGLATIPTNSICITIALKTLLGGFCAGAVSTLLAFFFAAFVRNRYLIVCLPFMITYMYSSLLDKIVYGYYDDFSEAGFEKAQFLMAFYPSEVLSGWNYTHKSNYIAAMIIFNVALVVAALTAFIVIMNKRTDLGE